MSEISIPQPLEELQKRATEQITVVKPTELRKPQTEVKPAIEQQKPPEKEKQEAMSTEQQKFVEGFDKNIASAHQKQIDAKEHAGDRLQKLQKKDLIKAGWKQIKYGVGGGAASLGLAMGGVIPGAYIGKNIFDKMPDQTKDQFVQAVLNNDSLHQFRNAQREGGVFAQFEQIGDNLAKQDALSNLSELYLRSGANIGAMAGNAMGVESTAIIYNQLRKKDKTSLPELSKADWMIGQLGLFLPFVNPVTVSGLRHVAEGFFQMKGF